MNVRKLVLSGLAIAAIASTTMLQAQDDKKGKGRGMMTAEQRIERLEQAVGSLSAEQKTKITAIYAKASEKMQALPQEERREKGMEIMQASQKEVRAVLTAEQQKKFDEMPQGRGPGGGSSNGGGKKKKDQ